MSPKTFVFLYVVCALNFSWANEARMETLTRASEVCADPIANENMTAYCDLVFGYAKESPLSPRGVLGKRILIGRCDHDTDCPSEAKCLKGRCFEDVLNQGSCRSDFDCFFSERCENSRCTSQR